MQADLGIMRMKTKGGQFRLRANALACSPGYGGELLVASVAGANTSIEAFKGALLSNNMPAEFTFEDCPALPWRSWKAETKHDKYKFRTAKLGCNTYHAVAILQRSGLLTSDSPAALWQELSSERYDTPLLQSWMPALKQLLIDGGYWEECKTHGCAAVQLTLDGNQLDGLVSKGLASGVLRIE